MRRQPAILVVIAVELRRRPTAGKGHICEDSFAYGSYSRIDVTLFALPFPIINPFRVF